MSGISVMDAVEILSGDETFQRILALLRLIEAMRPSEAEGLVKKVNETCFRYEIISDVVHRNGAWDVQTARQEVQTQLCLQALALVNVPGVKSPSNEALELAHLAGTEDIEDPTSKDSVHKAIHMRLDVLTTYHVE